MITPGDIMDGASASERPFPSDTLVTGFFVDDKNKDGTKVMFVKVDKKVKSLKEFPAVFDTVMLTDAQAIYPELFAKLSKEWGVPVDKLLAVNLKINTVGGELEMVMVTDGDNVLGTNGSRDKSDVIAKIAGADFTVPALFPITNRADTNNTADVIGSRLAGEIMETQGTEIKTLGELMASTDLTNPDEFSKLQERLRKVWLIMGVASDSALKSVKK